MTQAPAFSRGGESAQEADEAARASGSFRKTHYFEGPGKGNFLVLRYLWEAREWVYAAAHPSVPTKNQPADWPSERKWPASMPGICRYDKAFKGNPETGVPAIFHDCYVCDAKLTNQWGRACNPVIRVWTVAVLRDEVLGTQEMVDAAQIKPEMIGRRVGFRDQMRTVDEIGPDGKATGNKVQEIALILVNQSMKTYFNGLLTQSKMLEGTLTDRDFAVTQNNEGKDVDYVHTPFSQTPNLRPGTDSWKRYEEAAKEQGLTYEDVTKQMYDRASDDFYATFFDPNKVAPPRKKAEGEESTPSGGQGAPAAQQSAAPAQEASPEALEAMRARVRGAAPAQAATEPAQAAPAAQAPAQPATEPAASVPVSAGVPGVD